MQISKFWLQKSVSGEPEESVSDQSDEQELHRFAWTYRLVNVVLHAIATQLFAHILIDHFGVQTKHALLAAVHFAVHPIHTEAVSKPFQSVSDLCFLFHASRLCKLFNETSMMQVAVKLLRRMVQVIPAKRLA